MFVSPLIGKLIAAQFASGRMGGIKAWLLLAIMLLGTAVVEGISFAQNEEPLPELMAIPSQQAENITTRDANAPAQGGSDQAQLKAAQAAYDQATALYINEMYEEAAESFKKAYSARPFPQFLYNVGAAYHMKGKKQGDIVASGLAVEYYKRYLMADPQAADRAKVENAIAKLSAEISHKYSEIVGKIHAELALPFTNPNDPGLYQRRQRLKALFASVPPTYATLLSLRLGDKSSCGNLSRQFHYRLATPTRQELLNILKRIPRSGPFPSEEDKKEAVREIFDEGQDDFTKGKYDEAVECFKKSYSIHPIPQFLYNIGSSYEMKGKKQGNVAAYEQTVVYYRRYLAEAPQASDRATVEKSISATATEIARLKSRTRR